MTDVPDLPSLAAQTRWVRALARQLVLDPSLADDLAQDAWVAAVKSGSHLGALKRAWFGTVLRRRLFERRREQAARNERELRTARREELPSTLAMVERAAIQRDLVQAVLELDEPYRTTVLWRFFEELEVREIAERAGIPIATVHTRLARALEKLRARLDRDYGGTRGAWIPPLVLVADRGGSGPTLLGALLMKAATKIALVLVGLVSTVALWKWSHPGSPASAEPPTVTRAPDSAEPKSPPESRGELASVPLSSDRDVVPSTQPPSAKARETPEAAALRRLRGRVLDEHGRPLSGVRLQARPSGAKSTVESESGGRFEIAVANEADRVVSADERFATVLAGSARTNHESIVVVAPRVDLGGVVVTEDGAPLQGVALTIRTPPGFGADFGTALDSSVPSEWDATSDERGAFALADAPALEGAMLHAHLGGFEPHSEPVPFARVRDLRLVLRRTDESNSKVRGIVLDEAGTLVHGARVALGMQTVFTDSAGRFELDSAQKPLPRRISAIARDHQPAVRELEGDAWPAEIVLRLGARPLSIQGRVLDWNGDPVDKARVWLADPTFFGIVEREPLHVEALVGSEDLRFLPYVETDPQGNFRLDGLLDRNYRLVALDARTLLQAESAPARAGAKDVVVRLPKDALFARLRGRVVTPSGEGIAAASVRVQRFAFAYDFPTGGTRDEFSRLEPVKADAEGRFELLDVPREGVELFAFGDPILFAHAEVHANVDPDQVRIVAHRRLHLQVELDAPIERADQLRVLDAADQPLMLRVMRGETSFSNRKADIVDGRSQVLSLSDEASTLVLLKNGAEVGRVAIRLRIGDVNVVRW